MINSFVKTIKNLLNTLGIVPLLMLYLGWQCFDANHALGQEDTKVSFEAIDQLIEREKLHEALIKLKNISTLKEKEKAEVKIRIGRIYLQLDNPAKALTFFEAASFLVMNNGQAYLGLAQSMLRLGRLTQARRNAKSALRDDPDLIAAQLVIAKIESRTGQVESAYRRFEKLLKNQPKNGNLVVAYAEFLSNRNEYHLGIKLLKQFILRSPFSAEAVDKLGQVYWLDGKKEQAVAHRKAAAKLYASQDNLYRANSILSWVKQIHSLATESLKQTPNSVPKKKKKNVKRRSERVEQERQHNPPSPILTRPEPIKIPKGSSITQGSGFVVTGGSRVITNYHVINGAKKIITRNGSGEVRNARIIASSQTDDLAVLLLDKPYPKNYAIPYERMGDPRPGRSAVVMGYPMGSVLGIGTPSLTEGIVSKVYQSGKNENNFQITAKLNKGNSGGPVFDRRGNLIGVAVAKLDTTAYFKEKGYLPEDVNFAVKISRMLDLVQQSVPNRSQLASEDQGLEALYEMTLPSVVLVISIFDSDRK